ncbi:MAG: TlpA disulfide reductase family protein [Lachnospiraceae bacterium]
MKKKILCLLCMVLIAMGGCGGSAAQQEEKELSKSVPNEEITEESVEETNTDDAGRATIQMGEFEAETLSKEAATQEIFEKSQLTMLNIWATFCGPCIQEMEGLGELNREYDSQKFQIVGLISDVYSQEQSEEIQKVIEENMETARVIIDATKADYTHLLLNQPLWEKLGGYMQYVPTTIFLDSEGRQVGEIYSSASQQGRVERNHRRRFE